MMQADDPPFLTVGTEVSAKYKGAFCEAKVNKVVKAVKVKVTFKYGQGVSVVHDDCIKGPLKVGAQVKALHPDKNQFIDGIINKIQDCSQYTVVFDDGDITTLRRSSLCLKSGRHFAESETLDQLPLTHPEHFGTPVVGGRRGRRSRHHPDSDDASSEEDDNVHKRHRSRREEWESDIGKVVCVEIGDKKKQKDNWFPGLVVAPTAQDSVKIETKKDYLVRSFQDGRYYTVPKKEATAFSREIGSKVTQSSLRTAVEKAFLYIDRDELPPHWDRDLLFGVDMSDFDIDKDSDSDTSDDEPREEKDHFVAQLYKFMEECGTPINKGPTIGTKDLDLYKLFKIVQKLGGFNRVMNQNQWKVVSVKMCLHSLNQSASLVKAAYKKYLQSFEDFYRKLGCTMVSSPRGSRTRHRSGRSLIRDCDKRPSKKKGRGGETDSAGDDTDRKDEDTEEEDTKKEEPVKEEMEEKKVDKKDKEGTPLRISTPPIIPSRTISPTTRERTKEVKGLRQDKVKPKILPKEQRNEEVKKKDIKEEPMLGRKSRADDGRRREIVKEECKKEESNSEEDEEEEIEEKTLTRSLRNREEKEKDAEMKKITEKKVRHDHQRSASCNSTSSGTSSASSTTSSSFTGDPKPGLKGKPKLPKTPNSCEEVKRRGRKKKVEGSEAETMKSLLPSHIPISIGDKLLVLYGPTNKEAKVTYEAKVLEVEENTSNKMYYVHYLGWNTRYDEWVERRRVAQNLTWSQTRAKKGRGASKENEKKEEKKDKEIPTVSSSRQAQPTPAKRGRPFLSSRRESDRSDSASSTRASTRSERGNHSHSHSASPSSERLPTEPRRSRRRVLSSTIRDTEESDSDDTEPETDVHEQDQKLEPEIEVRAPINNSHTSPNNESLPASSVTLSLEEKISEPRVEQEVKQEPVTLVPISSQNSCGKDIDLKAIESEMKGLDKPIKKEECLNICREVTGRILTTVIPGSLTITEKKKHDPKKPFDSPVKRMEIPVRLVPAQEIMGQIKPLPISGMKKEPLLEEDIYEFKEPEPFEFSDIRSRKDCSKNRAQGNGMQDENESEAKVKKKGRPKKDGEDKSETEIEVCSLTPQKRHLTLSKDIKELPSKRMEVNKETTVKKEFKDYSRRPESFKPSEEKVIKDVIKEPLRIASPPCLQIKESGSSECIEKPYLIDFFNPSKEKQMHRIPLDIKDLKLDLCDSKESHFFGSSVVITPKKLPVKKEVISNIDTPTPVKNEPADITPSIPIDVREDASFKQEPPKIGVIPNPGNSNHIAVVIDRPTSAPLLSRISGGIPSHIIAPVVMPPVESRVLAKPIGIKPPNIETVTEKTLIITPATTVQTITSIKQEDRNEGRLMPFSQRQQQIFPHLLNRSDSTEEKIHTISVPRTTSIVTPVVVLPANTQKPMHLQPVPEPQITAPVVSSSPKIEAVDTKPIISIVEKPQPLERPKCESTVEESIEAVILRARQDQAAVEEEKKESKLVEKRRRIPGRSKKLVSREFLPDTSEESDDDSKYDKTEHRQKRLKVSDRAKYSPAKKTMRLSGEDEKALKRCDEEERANDADEEDNECNFIPQKTSIKESFKQRRKDVEGELEKEQQGEASRYPKKKRSSTFRRPEDAEEAALGDLLCEETIPPGSPMPHDNLSADSESPAQTPAIKHEMPFASVPTGSSFSKRGPTLPSTMQTNFQKLQQLHPSVCIQSVSKAPVTSTQAFCPVSQPTIQPNVTITSVSTIQQLHSLSAAKVSSVSSLSSFRAQSSATSAISTISTPTRTLPLRTSVEVLPKNIVSVSNICNPEENASKIAGSAFPAPSNSPVMPSIDLILQKEEEQKVTDVRPNPLPTLDNTPPTTPESIVSNLSDSPQRENDSSKNDENSKSGCQYSSEMETDNKLDNYSEDSNTMDSSVSVSKCHGTSSKRPSSVISRGPCQQSHSEGWDTEDGSVGGLLPPKRRKKGTRKVHQCLDDEKSPSGVIAGCVGSSGHGKRRRRHSSSRGSSRCEDENDPAHGLNTLSLAACNSSRGKSRYNFCQELDPDLDATKRIAVLQTRIQELKRTYRHVKAELASVERRRKKLRKKEREKEALQEAC